MARSGCTLAAAVGEETDTVEDVVEPYLLQLGFLQRTPPGPRGHASAYGHLGVTAPGPPALPGWSVSPPTTARTVDCRPFPRDGGPTMFDLLAPETQRPIRSLLFFPLTLLVVSCTS